MPIQRNVLINKSSFLLEIEEKHFSDKLEEFIE
jgi:hypothetical protein